MAPPHFDSSRIQAQYSSLGRSSQASVNVSGSSATVRAISALRRRPGYCERPPAAPLGIVLEMPRHFVLTFCLRDQPFLNELTCMLARVTTGLFRFDTFWTSSRRASTPSHLFHQCCTCATSAS